MFDFIFEVNNVLFTTALVITLGAFSLETIGVLIAGIDLFGIIESFLPELDTGEPDLDDLPLFHQILGWAKHKNCPAAIWGILFTGSFGVLGLILQSMVNPSHAEGGYLTAFIAVPVCLLPSLIVTSYISKGLGAKVFVDSTAAVSKDSLVGCRGYITIGKATTDSAAEVSVKDQYGKSHLIMCMANEGELNKSDMVEITELVGNSAIACAVNN